MKKKIKVTQKLIDEMGIDLPEELDISNLHIKRVSYDSDIDIVLPHDDNRYCMGKITTIDVDSDGDIVIPSGIDFTRFKKNPVVLFNHSMMNPIGFAEEINVQEDAVWAKTRFGSTEEAQKIYQLIKDKVLRTHSIGFIPLEGVQRGEKGFTELLKKVYSKYPERYSEEKLKTVDRILTKVLMLEYSIVTIPANEDAVIQEIKNIKEQEEPEVQEEAEVQEKEQKDITNISESNIELQEEPEEIVEDVIEETIPEKHPEIKIVKRSSTIKRKSTKKEREFKKLQKLYQKIWGV